MSTLQVYGFIPRLTGVVECHVVEVDLSLPAGATDRLPDRLVNEVREACVASLGQAVDRLDQRGVSLYFGAGCSLDMAGKINEDARPELVRASRYVGPMGLGEVVKAIVFVGWPCLRSGRVYRWRMESPWDGFSMLQAWTHGRWVTVEKTDWVDCFRDVVERGVLRDPLGNGAQLDFGNEQGGVMPAFPFHELSSL